MTAAQEQAVFMQYLEATDDFPFLAGREAKIQFVELHANAGRSSMLTMCRQMEGYPADKDLKTQYEWAKAWSKRRFRQLGWDTDSHSDTDNDEDSQGTGKASSTARAPARTPPTAKRASKDSGGEPQRKRRHRRIAAIDKVINRIRAGAEKAQLIRPDNEAGNLDRELAELINVCIEHPHVRSLELLVSEIQHPLHAEIETDLFLWPLAGNSAWCDGGASLRSYCAPRARDAQQWPPTRLPGPVGNYDRRRGGTLAG
jgi:hypothetical protein